MHVRIELRNAFSKHISLWHCYCSNVVLLSAISRNVRIRTDNTLTDISFFIYYASIQFVSLFLTSGNLSKTLLSLHQNLSYISRWREKSNFLIKLHHLFGERDFSKLVWQCKNIPGKLVCRSIYFPCKLVARWSWKIWRDKSNLWTFYDFCGSGNRFIVYFMKRNDVPCYLHAYVDFFNKLLLLALLLEVHICFSCILRTLRYIIQNFRYIVRKICWIISFLGFIRSW